jgi:hypothetical protein
MALAKLFKEYLGSPEERSHAIDERVGNSYLPQSIAKLETYPGYTAANKFDVEEPVNIHKLHEQESRLPSSLLYTVPFPDSATSGKYLPSYVKSEHLAAPLHLYPRKSLQAKPKKIFNRRKNKRLV